MSTIKDDLFRYAGSRSYKAFLKVFFFNPGYRFTYFFRKAGAAHRLSPMKWIYLLMYRRCVLKYGFQIPLRTRIEPGFFIAHTGTIVINPRTIIGKNCNISHLVTIGQANRGEKQGTPRIGNSVWIGAGAAIVGKITIGDNVLIAPNTFVNFDVPDNSIVLGNPGKIMPSDAATQSYINRKV